MAENKLIISLDSIDKNLFLLVIGKTENSVFEVEDAEENGEARFQIKEGCYYHYKFSSPSFFFEKDEVIEQDPFNHHQGRIVPNIYVGTLNLPVFSLKKSGSVGGIAIEVRSKKTDYRKDYRFMLENITEHCTDLLMQVNSPVSQNFEPDFSKGSETIYQRFTFIKSVIDTDEFNEAVHRIVTSPNTAWCRVSEEADIRNLGKLKSHHVRQFVSQSHRTNLKKSHGFYKKGITSLPARIQSDLKTETVDTAENRFIKHALQSFLKLCVDIKTAVKPGSRIDKEVTSTIEKLEQHLHHTFFSEISRAQILKLNSPILQKKEGYREILRAWLMFDLAAKLVWKGGEEVYAGGKKDIAALYEYWLFFTLLDLLKSLFELDSVDLEDLIKPTNDGLSLQLVQGEKKSIRGVLNNDIRKLQINFSFNRTFSKSKEHPEPGSWTKSMRPDYTLSIWPYGISEERAEKEELIVHIHFDAKYKVENFTQLISEEDDLNQEKKDQLKGSYKNADLLKMHAYKDAIRRTGGAYVLYPGTDSITRKGFHEILPGLGAFPIRPSRDNSGIEALRSFILQAIDHFINRASQRENLAYRIFDIHKSNPDELKEPLPEAYGANRDFIPSEINVLIGYFKGDSHLKWITTKKLYNVRVDDRKGAIPLTASELSAKYLLLHTKTEESSGRLYKIIGNGPKVFSKEKMIHEGYPTKNSYLIFEVEEDNSREFQKVKWDFRSLEKFEGPNPFTVTLTELMNRVV